ncbi:MAG: 3-dehydroquinate synthase [Oscillospiraceae bacterium]|jgi:3-dehydroquinate synthase|nr:3-dehydroquinate synthase [Oscillospiraceae bacterium]
MRRLDVELGERSYPIFIGEGALRESAERIAELCGGGRAAVVTDTNVRAAHGDALSDVLRSRGVEAETVAVEPGEGGKSIANLERLYHAFAGFGLRRSDAVIAFGGGVVGDLAGFAAATYMRGVALVQIPTTLLAQVDSSVGGKVAVNIDEGKNLVGSFYQPRLVISDVSLLGTLPERELYSGMAEVVKYAAIGESGLAGLLASRGAPSGRLGDIVYMCCRCKAGYVRRDERDTGERMTLNFGHTFGHAIEKYYGYGTYLHGEAVAMGMALAARAGEALGVTSPEASRELLGLMDTCGLRYDFDGDPGCLIPLMAGDKKNTDGDITLILLENFGAPTSRRISGGALGRALTADAAQTG